MKSIPRAPPWVWLNAAAFAVSLAHYLTDWHIGLFGASSSFMSPAQAGLVAVSAGLYGWWALALGAASHAGRSGLGACFILVFGWAFLLNGLIALAVCFPPCGNAFPVQDITHIGNVIFGGLASWATWRAFVAHPEPAGWGLALGAFVLLALTVSVETFAFVS